MIKNDEYLFINFKTLFDGYNCYGWSEAISRHKSDPPPYRPNIGYIFNLGKENYLACEYDKFPDKSGKILEIKPGSMIYESFYILSRRIH